MLTSLLKVLTFMIIFVWYLTALLLLIWIWFVMVSILWWKTQIIIFCAKQVIWVILIQKINVDFRICSQHYFFFQVHQQLAQLPQTSGPQSSSQSLSQADFEALGFPPLDLPSGMKKFRKFTFFNILSPTKLTGEWKSYLYQHLETYL